MLSILGLGTLIAIVYFALTWALSVRMNNYGFLDVAWSFGVTVLAPLYVWLGPGDFTRKALFTALGVAWSLRLGIYILIRVLRHHPNEDARYQGLRLRWKGPAMFLVFFEMQALLVAVFSLPFLFAAFNPSPSLQPLEFLGLGVVALALLGEATADWQMQKFKADPTKRGEVCQVGLWRYSRHPNYFFESMVWWGFFIAALSSPYGWISLVCPVLILYFLLKVTGIPLTEEYAIKSKGEAYRAYQRSTSAFVPWFRKSNSQTLNSIS
jgi:steroid 5-alpha reductase family enzyme